MESNIKNNTYTQLKRYTAIPSLKMDYNTYRKGIHLKKLKALPINTGKINYKKLQKGIKYDIIANKFTNDYK